MANHSNTHPYVKRTSTKCVEAPLLAWAFDVAPVAKATDEVETEAASNKPRHGTRPFCRSQVHGCS